MSIFKPSKNYRNCVMYHWIVYADRNRIPNELSLYCFDEDRMPEKRIEEVGRATISNGLFELHVYGKDEDWYNWKHLDNCNNHKDAKRKIEAYFKIPEDVHVGITLCKTEDDQEMALEDFWNHYKSVIDALEYKKQRDADLDSYYERSTRDRYDFSIFNDE